MRPLMLSSSTPYSRDSAMLSGRRPYTLDSKDSKVREHLAERADLLGAIRLPNNAFKANAGTEVVSDILWSNFSRWGPPEWR